jgi:hypothetical protein
MKDYKWNITGKGKKYKESVKNPFWHYRRDSHIFMLEECYLKIVIPKEEMVLPAKWEVIRITVALGEYYEDRIKNCVGNGIKQLGISPITFNFLQKEYLKPHQIGNTANPCTEEEFDKVYKDMIDNHKIDPHKYCFFK